MKNTTEKDYIFIIQDVLFLLVILLLITTIIFTIGE